MSDRRITFESPGAFGPVELEFDVGDDWMVHVAMNFRNEWGRKSRRAIVIIGTNEQAVLVGWLMANLAQSGVLSFSDELQDAVREVTDP